MKAIVASVLAAVMALASPTPALAYLKFGVQVGATVRPLKWEGPIRYFVTDRAVAGVTPGQFQEAVGRAFATWAQVDAVVPRATFQGITVDPPGAFDNRTTLGFLDRPDLDRVLGATSFLLDATTGEILESDVFFNTRFDWSVATPGQAGRVDLESVALHEIGHLLGLGHSALGETELQAGGSRRVLGSGAVMFPISLTAGATADRVLQPDDVAGILDLYGSDDASSRSPSITGRVTRNGSGVFGAHVVAFNLETGRLVGGFALGSNGAFVIAGLSPGPHLIRVEPIDDADTSSFFTGPIGLDFRVTFAPRVVIVPSEGTSDEVVVEVAPR